MVQYDPRLRLPTAEELPDSEDIPVDNELQDSVPGLLKEILCLIWANRDDWFFGVDMGIYADTEQPYRAIIPDGFLCLDVPRMPRANGRLSYVLWQEAGKVPVLVLEVVSQTYRGEYDSKLEQYRQLDVLYYAVYDATRDQPAHAPLEVYKLEGGRYERLTGEPVWMPEIGLGLGRAEGENRGWQREWLYWYAESGERYPTPVEFHQYRADLSESALAREQEQVERERQRAERERQRAEQAEQQAQRERERAERLAELLRQQGIDPD